LAESNCLWDNRIAIVSTFAFIKQKDSDDTYCLALKMMNHKHDLMHKAIGWMLRESGKRDDARRLFTFVDEHRHVMPRTMLRYAIEKFSDSERMYLMRK
jgi:3-methyladenine DNA glycosylase AlkD